MKAEKAIIETLFSKPPEQYSEKWARHFRKRLADLGWLVVRAPEKAEYAVREVAEAIRD